MNRQKIFTTLLALLFTHLTLSAQTLFNDGWLFSQLEAGATEKAISAAEFDDSQWQSVSLPHTANIEPLTVNDQWQGICYYRKSFEVENYSADKIYYIEFEAAMNHTTIWLNGLEIKQAQGGYLPIVVDITPMLKEGENVMAVRLDNRDNPITGPKPLAILDFNMYGGIYRNVWLIENNKQHITHPILANRAASGGVFITTPIVGKECSQVRIQTHVENQDAAPCAMQIKYEIYDGEQLVKSGKSQIKELMQYANDEFVELIDIKQPKLWSPSEPNLYRAIVSLYSGDTLVDQEETRFGIRRFEFADNQLYINGEKTYLRGVNRHQEYPFVGYALSDNAQYRDAVKIKEAGFDYIRLSHYPQSPAFMRACDELGLVVADAILGWQYYAENDLFKNQSYESARTLIRRDRNHPCVMAWEVSLNETAMPISFMQVLHNIVHQEYPGAGVYSCGWMPQVYDIYFQARQHRILHPDAISFEKPYMVSEYGDWEYYSNNAGLNQHQHSREMRLELSSRQFRSNGEAGQLQQALNLQESHNDNMSTPATADSYWVMYDYNRGYHDVIEASGIMDIFRLPKFGYYFYASQSDQKPQLKIGSWWSEKSSTQVKVWGNCEQVKLYLNGKLVDTQTPKVDSISQNLNHPPFIFNVAKFKSGTLRADGYVGGKKVSSDTVRTAGKATALKCWIGESGKAPQAGCNDVVFLYVAAVDRNGTICHDFTGEVEITLDGKATILNPDAIEAEAGIATALIKIENQTGISAVKAQSDKLKGTFTFEIK